MRCRLGWVPLVTLLITMSSGCDNRPLARMPLDDGEIPRPDAGDPPEPDAGPMDDAGPPPLDCAAELVADRTFDVDPGGLPVQIHAAAAFDGEGVWIAYDTVEEGDTGLFDVWVVRLRCDGTAAFGPFRVNTNIPFNDTDPEVVVGDGRVLVTWSSDDGTGGTDNMHAFHRVLSIDGTPAGDDVELRTERGGVAVPDNHLSSSAVATETGFDVAGFRAVSVAPTFQLFIQSLDADGALAGEALEPFVDDTAGFLNPVLARGSDENRWLAWERQEVGVETQVFFTSLDGTGAPELALGSLATTAGPHVAVDATDPSVVYAALSAAVVGTALDVRLTDLGRDAADRPVEVLGARGRDDYGARLAAHPDGGAAIAFYTNVSGLDNELILQRFTYDGTDFTVGPETSVTRAAAPYQPALTHVIGDVWLTAWAEGESPDFVLEARFVTLPSP